MNRNLLKTLMIASALFMGATSLWADDEEEVTYQLLKTIDFEDADTYSSGWTIGNGASASQGTLSDGTYYMLINQGGGSGDRTCYYTISETSFLSAEQWKLEYTFGATASNTNASTFTVYDADNTTLFYISQSSYNATGTVYNSEGTSIGTITLEAYTKAAPTVWVTVILTGSSEGTTLTINDSDGNASVETTTISSNNLVPAKLNFVLGRAQPRVGVDDIKMYIASEEEVISTPTAAITGVNGKQRTITMSCETEGVNIFYKTSDSEDATANAYSEPITISETTTLYIYATTTTGGQSETATYTFEAGTDISVALSSSVTALTASDDVYYPTYSFTSDNSSILCTPTATLAATLDGSTIDDFDGTYAFTADGTLVVTASADGYTSTSVTVQGVGYTLCEAPSVDYDEINSSNIEDVLGDGFTLYEYPEYSESYTRFSSWSTTGGVNADGTANGSSQYYFYRSSGTSISLDDYATYANSGCIELVVGYGFGSGSRATSVSIPEAEDNSIAAYEGYSYATAFGPVYVTYAESETLGYTVARYATLSSAKYYVPAKEVSKTIGTTGYASFSSTYNVEVPEGIEVYIATNVGEETVTLETIEAEIIPANTGVILSGTASAEYTFQVTYEESEADFSSNILIASSEYPTVGSDGEYTTYYGLYADASELEFAKITSGIEVDGDKAYLGVSDTSSEAKSLKVVFGTTTGISEISSSKAQEAGAFYNLQGVKVQSPQKGLYIQDGKKVILK